MYEFSKYLSYLLVGYGISTVIFLIVSLFLKQFKSLRPDYLNISNLIALFLSLALTVLLIFDSITSKIITDNLLASPAYGNLIYSYILVWGIIPMLFLFKKFRQNVWATLIVILSVNWFHFSEWIYIWIIQFFGDYMASNWTTYYADNPTVYLIGATFLYFTLTFFLAIKKTKT